MDEGAYALRRPAGEVLGRDFADRAGRGRQQRQAGVAEHRHGQGVSVPIPKRLEIIHHIDDEYVKDGNTINITAVASRFGVDTTTVAGIWKGRDKVEPDRRGPPPAPGLPHLAEDAVVLDIISHPPRRDVSAGGAVNDHEKGRGRRRKRRRSRRRRSNRGSLPLLSALLRAVRNATSTLIVAVYCFSDETLATEVVAAANKGGVKVKMFLDYKMAMTWLACPAMFIDGGFIERAEEDGLWLSSMERESTHLQLHGPTED